MKPQYHVLAGGVTASLLIPVLGVNSAFFLASSVLIDADHYLDYLHRNGFKDFSIKRMFIFHELLFKKGQEREFLGLNILHTVESLLLLYGASVLTNWMWLKAVLWGMVFHIVTDLIYLYRWRRLFRRAFSIIEYVIRQRSMKRQGLDPQLPYRSVLEAMALVSRVPKDKIGKAEQ